MSNSRLIRAGPGWLEFEEALKAKGVRFTRPQLTDSVGVFLIRENFIPLMAERAHRASKRRLF